MFTGILSRIASFFIGVWKGFIRFGRKFGWVKTGLGILVVIIVGWTIVHFLTPAPTEVSLNQTRTVTLKSVADLSSDSSPLAVAGTVSSKSEAQLRADVGGRITSVNYTLGDYVNAGAVIASVENASQRASVAQAQGVVDAASAGASVSETTLVSAQAAAGVALLSAYGAVDKTIHTDTDAMFSNPESDTPQFSVQSSDSQSKIDTENLRARMKPILAREAAQSSSISASTDLSAEMVTTEAELKQVRDYLDALIRTLNSGIATNGVSEASINAYLATANADRSAIVGAYSGLVSAQSAIANAQKGADTQSGSSAAALTQAQAGLASARANLEKTIIRAPISGTINSLSLKVGDYLSANAVAAVIANNGALEITAYVTDTDAHEIAAGSTASIETPSGEVTGTVTRVAPAIDPATKKVEVRIGITGGASNLVNGQSVTVSINRVQKATPLASKTITLPLSALKVGADSISVFTVDENNKLVPHVVTLGQLLGDRVVIASGVDATMLLVTDARGLQPGQTVDVK